MIASGPLRQTARLLALWLVAAATRAPRLKTPVRRVLVLRPDHLGDLLFATPALRRLRAGLSGVEIVALVGPWGEPILRRSPSVDSLITWDIPWFNRRPRRHVAEPYLSAVRLARTLERRGFDAALNLRFDFWWGALAAQLAGVPQRVGYAVREVRPFLTTPVPHATRRHEVEQNLALVDAFLGQAADLSPDDRLEFPLRDDEVGEAESLLASRGIGAGDRLLAVHPGAGSPLKLWVPSGFAAVVDALATRLGAKVVLTGSSAEQTLVAAVQRHSRLQPVSVVGLTSVGVLAAIFRRARLVLGPDSGPLHLAVAVGAPTVHLYGPVDPRAFGPWGDSRRHAIVRADLPCSPCDRLDICALPGGGRPCMLSISPDSVLEAAERVLEATEG